MPELLRAIDVPFQVLEEDGAQVERALDVAKESLASRSGPYALIVKPGLFRRTASESGEGPKGFTRAAAIECLVRELPAETLFVSTTGKASRELYFLREDRKETHSRDFYVVGAMGCASAIALGVAMRQKERGAKRTVCALDGDGALLMQLGSLATIGSHQDLDLLHVVLDNEAYESTGGQPSLSPNVDIPAVASACGYRCSKSVTTAEELRRVLREALSHPGPRLIAVKVAPGSESALGRPSESPRQNAGAFRQGAEH